MPATVYCHGLPSGQTLTATVYPDGSNASSDTDLDVTEIDGKPTSYSFSLSRTGVHLVHILRGTTVIGTAWTPQSLTPSGSYETCDSRAEALLATTVSAAVGDGGDIDGYSRDESLRLALAVLAGTVEGGGTTTNEFTALDGSKVRVTSTVDEDGNRSAVTLDAN